MGCGAVSWGVVGCGGVWCGVMQCVRHAAVCLSVYVCVCVCLFEVQIESDLTANTNVFLMFHSIISI